MNLFKKFIPIVQKGKPGGVAILDASGHLEWSELPDGLSGGMSYQGLLDASGGSYPLVPVNHAAPIASGDYWKVSVGGNLVGSHGIKKTITKAETSGGGLDTKFTCASHGYHNADVIWISGTTSYNGLRTVSSVTANTFIVTGLAFVANETGSAQETETITWVAGDLCIWNNLSWDKMSDADLPVIIPFNHAYYVDGSRVDPYTEDGSISRPYKKLKTCLDAINIDSAAKMAAADYDSTKYIVKVMPGTYSDALTILSAKYLRIELDGVKLSGAITATLNHASPLSPGGDYYSKLEFVGGRGNRANRGEQAWISSDITFSRNDASLQYVTFAGINLTGNVGFTSDGVWVVYMENSYHNDNTKYFHTTGNAKVLLETYGYNFLKCNFTKLSDVASASDISFYDCNETTFYVINSTPFYDCWFKNCLFSAATSLVSANTLKIDANSLVSLRAQTPTLTGMSLTQLDAQPTFKNSADAVGATWDVYKSRGKYGTPLAVVTGDNVYTQNFWLHDGTNYLNMAGIEVEAAGTIAATQTPTNMLFKIATDTTPSVKSTVMKLWYNLRAQFYGEIHSSTNTVINAMYDDNQATYRTKLTLWNSSTATAGVPNQYAPSLNFLGHVYNTTGAGSDETSEWRMGARVTSGTTPSSTFYLRYSANGGAYSDVMTVTGTGTLTVYSGTRISSAAIATGSINNSSDSNNSAITFNSTGVLLSRNIADANAACITNLIHASSTANIHCFHWQSILRACVSKEGNYLSYANSTDAVGRQLNFLKSRGSLASKTICVSADVAGYVSGWHYDGVNDLETSRVVLTSYSALIGATRIGGKYELWLRPDSAGGALAKVMEVFPDGSTTINGKVTKTSAFYAGMYAYSKAIPLNINTVNIYHAIHLVTAGDIVAGDLDGFTFYAGALVDADITSITSDGGGTPKARVTCSGNHNLTTNDIVCITKATFAGYNGKTKVTVVSPTVFDCQTISYVADENPSAAEVVRPAYLLASAGSTGEYSVSMAMSATSGNNKVIKIEGCLNTTDVDKFVSEKTTSGGIDTFAATGNIAITAGDKFWLQVMNLTDTTDLTIKHFNLHMKKI